MSLAASPRRDKRRRLIALWGRSESSTAAQPIAAGRPATYAPDAAPERQPPLAVFVPVGLGGFAACAAGLLAVTALAAAPGIWQILGGRLAAAPDARFAATTSAAAACIDGRSLDSLGGFVAEACLVVATGLALVVGSIRRHRRDDFQGRYRAWAWLGCLYAMTACAGRVPLGRLVAALVLDLTGIALGADGSGWWLLVATVAWVGVGLWAVTPLHERLATGGWLAAGLTAWAVSAAGTLLADVWPDWSGRLAAVNAAWIAGAGLSAIAMFAAARSVIREVRGLPSLQEPAKRQPDARPVAARPHAPATSAADRAPPVADPFPARIAFTDGSDADDDDGADGGRHLSKAERRRLRKLAKMNRAA